MTVQTVQTKKDDERLREALVEGRLLDEVKVRVVLDYQRSVGGSLRDIVVRLGFLTAEALEAALSGSTRVSVTASMVVDELAARIPARLLRGCRALPVTIEGEQVLAAEDAELEPIIREELWNLLGTQLLTDIFSDFFLSTDRIGSDGDSNMQRLSTFSNHFSGPFQRR